MISVMETPKNKRELVKALQNTNITKVVVKENVTRTSIGVIGREITKMLVGQNEEMSIIIVKHRK